MRVLACEGSSGFLKTYRLRYRSCEMGEGEEVRVEPCGRTRFRVARPPATTDEVAAFETDVLAGFVLARAAAGLSDGTIASDVMHLEQVRNLWNWSRRRRFQHPQSVGRSSAARDNVVSAGGLVGQLHDL